MMDNFHFRDNIQIIWRNDETSWTCFECRRIDRVRQQPKDCGCLSISARLQVPPLHHQSAIINRRWCDDCSAQISRNFVDRWVLSASSPCLKAKTRHPRLLDHDGLSQVCSRLSYRQRPGIRILFRRKGGHRSIDLDSP